ncbi:MAG: hypothetical protein DMD91_27940 [Candidatus Rokuibacteriota bacterium]|nr:MAG: hypothetical protein DMD91_27940 [Candidatus Rokubacteria bacterium]
MQRTHQLRQRVSTKKLIELIFDWVKARTTSGEHQSLQRAADSIQMQEIWIPVARLHTESEFTVGRVIFKPMTAALFDRWRIEVLARNSEQAEYISVWFEKERKKCQGLAAATLAIEAERDCAIEVAFAEADDAVSMLRVLEGANLDPELVSCCTLLGKHGEEQRNYLLIRDGTLAESGSGFAGVPPPAWLLGKDELAFLMNSGLSILSSLLASDHRTAFQERLLDALRIYSRNGLAREPSDKLIYIVVALESIFVRDNNENLTANIAERIAFFLSREREGRRRIIEIIREGYALRSAFLHHGKKLEDLEALKRFMDAAFHCMINLIRNADRFHSVDQLHKAIENERLS